MRNMEKVYEFGAAEEAAREEEKRQQISRENRTQDLRDLLGTEGGRRTVFRWLNTTLGIEEDSFCTNAMQMARNTGVRAAALAIRADILSLCPELFDLMTRENNGRNRTDTSR